MVRAPAGRQAGVKGGRESAPDAAETPDPNPSGPDDRAPPGNVPHRTRRTRPAARRRPSRDGGAVTYRPPTKRLTIAPLTSPNAAEGGFDLPPTAPHHTSADDVPTGERPRRAHPARPAAIPRPQAGRAGTATRSGASASPPRRENRSTAHRPAWCAAETGPADAQNPRRGETDRTMTTIVYGRNTYVNVGHTVWYARRLGQI